MPTNKIRTLVDKIKNLNNKFTDLNFNSPIIEKKEKEILSKVRGINFKDQSVKTVATYFQNINLNKFTAEELEILLNINYSELNTNSTNIVKDFEGFDILSPPVDLNKAYINLDTSLDTIRNNHTQLLSVNKDRSFTFFLNYIISKL